MAVECCNHSLQSLWYNTYRPSVSKAFKTAVGKYSSAYAGSEQQDADEFFTWLLDMVHEDLNTPTTRISDDATNARVRVALFSLHRHSPNNKGCNYPECQQPPLV